MANLSMKYAGFNFVEPVHHETYPFISPSKLDFSGKHVFITGGSRGCGKAMAISYAQAGASGIAISARTDLSQAEKDILAAAEKAGRPKPHVLTLKVDTTKQDEVEAAARKVEEVFGKLDVLINNAGVMESFKPVAEIDPDVWWKTFEVNIKGVFLVTRSFLPLMLRGGDKTIIQISSIGAMIDSPGASSYQATKLAVIKLAESLRSEYGDQGLLSYSLHPGAVLTDLSKAMPEERWSILVDTPELCGDTIAWLTSEKRDWLADRYLSVNWDAEALLKRKDEIVENDLLKLKLRLGF